MSESIGQRDLPPAGWHPDPEGVARQRYWDGSSWASHVVDHSGVQCDELVVRADLMLPSNATPEPRLHQGSVPLTRFSTQNIHSKVVVTAPRSRGVAFLLTFFFGPLGMLSSTVVGGIVMFFVSLVLIPLTLGLAAIVLWPIPIVWAVLACPSSSTTAIQTTNFTGTAY